jgi:NDP-sugar pyrophosphorylase family protein
MSSSADRPHRAMVLAAGRGMRLRPVTEQLPKCMVRLGGRPLLEYAIRWLRDFDITDLVINLYHMPAAVTAYFGGGQRWGVHITYSVEREPLGTAGGVKRVESLFPDPFFVWYGDNISTCRLDRLWNFHRSCGGVATLALHQRDDPTHGGIVAVDGEDRVTRFLEKPGPRDIFSRWVNAGIYVLDPAVFRRIPSEAIADFGRDVFPSMLAAGDALYGYRMRGDEELWWIDRPEDLNRVESQWPLIARRFDATG